jgi:transposase
MKEEISRIENERVDDIPLLLAMLKEMGIIEIFNQGLKAHGNWSGMGMGYVIGVWLAYIVSTGDHRKNRLEEWVSERKETIGRSLGIEEVERLDFTDDRLGLILEKLSDDESWEANERAVNERIMRVYQMKAEVLRIDTTTASSYGSVSEEGLLQFGHSKDHRPDLGQVKIASVSLDPLGLPLVTIPVSGEVADDGLYLPAIEAARKSLSGKKGLLYVGDSKMAALATRSAIARQGDYYLMPLTQTQVNDEKMAGYLDDFAALGEGEKVIEQVKIYDEQEREVLLAEGFTLETRQETSYPEAGEEKKHAWQELRLIVRSPSYAKKQAEQLEKRLRQTTSELLQLVERRRGYLYPTSQKELQERVTALLVAHGCEDYLTVEIQEEIRHKNIRAYKESPARVEKQSIFHLQISRQEPALATAYKLLGWRAYATNAPLEKLPFPNAVEVYRDAHLHEHGYSRLKGKPLSLTPMYLQHDDQITGLIRLLSLALRLLTLMEFVVRSRLAQEDAPLTGVYAGNRNRKTKTPRTETLLEVFKGITLTILYFGDTQSFHLTPLTDTQQRILQLLGFSDGIYSALLSKFDNLVPKSAN